MIRTAALSRRFRLAECLKMGRLDSFANDGQHRIILTYPQDRPLPEPVQIGFLQSTTLRTFRAAKCGPYVCFSTELPSRCLYPHAIKDVFGRHSRH
jgi:hypothetical protein